jgi:two-component system sensor histidine kinase PilS (NtrC family)
MTSVLEERQWLPWLAKVRVIILTLLFAVQLATARLTASSQPIRPFIIAILLWYTISVFYLLLLSVWREGRLLSAVQVITDLVLASLVVYVTGGIDSSYNFLYPLVIIVACVLLPRLWSYLAAALAFLLYGAVLELSYFGVLPSYSATHPEISALRAFILINLFAYLAVAYLASQLAHRLRQADASLKNASGALEDLQALHENIIQSMSGGLITTNLNGHVRLVNAAGQALLERTQSALFAQPVASLFLDPLPPIEAKAAHTEVRCVNAAGVVKTLALRATPLSVPGRGRLGYVYTFDDLTEIRRLEHEVRMREQLSAVGRLGSAIAHEIRNPLSSIAGSVKFLSGIASLNDEQRLLTEIAQRESERLNTIISEFVNYSRAPQLEFESVDLVALLDGALARVHERLAREHAQVSVEIVREVAHAWTMGDAERLRQVMVHLCRQGARAMRLKGKLGVRLWAAADLLRLSFTDQGPGLTAQQAARVFEPFQAGGEGSAGLDLAIAYQIVQAHQGTLRVTSTPGQGTVFTMELLACPVAATREMGIGESESAPGSASAATGGGAHG